MELHSLLTGERVSVKCQVEFLRSNPRFNPASEGNQASAT